MSLFTDPIPANLRERRGYLEIPSSSAHEEDAEQPWGDQVDISAEARALLAAERATKASAPGADPAVPSRDEP